MMLNETLYECLVELGISEMKAKKAASENAKLERLCEDVGEIRLTLAQVLRQSAQINERLIDTEALVKVMIGRVDKLESRQERAEQGVDDIKSKIRTMEERQERTKKNQDRMEQRQDRMEQNISEIKGMVKILVDRG
ncbi:MAG: hypothetical protein ACPG5T_03145 [Endozoicomonas sp.]